MTIAFNAEFAFVFILVFARIGSMVATMPAFGEVMVTARVRLALALLISLVMVPIVGDSYSGIPCNLGRMTMAVLGEIAIGLLIGASARLLTSALQVAGTAIAYQIGLAFAQNVDPTQGIQSAIVGSFLSVLAMTMIFATDMHHLLIAAMRDSYELFKPGEAIPFGDFAQMALKIVAGAFKVGIQMAAPFIVFGMIFNLGQGVLSRLMPQVQIFFIAIPANIFLGFALFMLMLSSMMMWYLDHFSSGVGAFLQQ